MSKHQRKRKHDLDQDTSEAGNKSRSEDHDRGRRSPKRSKKTKDEDSESISIEETNRIRAELGLAPLEVDEPKKEAAADEEPIDEGDGEERVYNEDGIEIHHKAAKSLTAEKEEQKLREKIQLQKEKQRVYSKVLKASKGLADSDDEEDVDAWLQKSRKEADAISKNFDELDQAAEQEAALIQKKLAKSTPKKKKANASSTAGLVVGHSKEAFVDGTETILVLQDRDVLDENGEEVLINPNLIDNERHKRNVEMRKQKGTYNPYEEDTDEFGMTRKQQILAKYDEGLDGERQKETFRLDDAGTYDIDKEAFEQDTRRKLMMADKKFESLGNSKYTLATEFYTEEEMISFRKPKKKRERKEKKRKTLRAADLVPEPEEATEEEKAAKARRLALRRRDAGNEEESTSGMAETFKEVKPEVEEGEVVKEDAPKRSKWKDATGGAVNINRLRSLAAEDDEEESDDDDFVGGVNIGDIVVDDDADDELQSTLDRARKLKQLQQESAEDPASHVRQALARRGAIKEEADSEEEDDAFKLPGGSKGIVIDATSEIYKSIGEIPTYGLAGNRDDDVDYSELVEEHKKIAELHAKERERQLDAKAETDSDDSDMDDDDIGSGKRRADEDSRFGDFDEEEEKEKPRWKDFGEDEQAETSSKSKRDDKKRAKKEEDDDVYGADYQNVLGAERDVSKGVGAMLKMAAERGYLPTRKASTSDKHLDHLQSKRYSRVEQGKMEIEDKYLRKLERMGTTSSGPVRSFQDKSEYQPNVEISYTDKYGRVLDPKEAFRQISHKFHGKEPGKKQQEKRQAKLAKKERMKKMNSSDTPLGTLAKQLKKQEQTQCPFIMLSGSQRVDVAPLQKD